MRLGVVAAAGALALVVLPRLMPADPAPPPVHLAGAMTGGHLAYRDAPLADVLADVETVTRFRAVAFPDVLQQRFSGRIDLRHGGRPAIEALAAQTGLELRQAGPHWALVRAEAR